MLQSNIQFLEGQAGGVVCETGTDQTLCEEGQVVVEAQVKPSVDV